MATLAPEDFIVTSSFSNWHQLDAHSVTSKCIFLYTFFSFLPQHQHQKNLSGCSSPQKNFLLFHQLFFSFFHSYVPSIVPKHNKLVLTAGSKELDKTFFKRNVHLASSTVLAEWVNLFYLPWFHVSLCSHSSKRPEDDFFNLQHYTPIAEVKVVYIQYLTVVDCDIFMKMFPKLERAHLGKRVGRKNMFVEELRRKGVEVIEHFYRKI